MGESLGEVFSRHSHPEHGGRHRLHHLRRQTVVHRIERGIAGRRAAQRVEPSGEMAVAAVGGDQGHSGSDRSQQLGLRRGGRGDHRFARRRDGPCRLTDPGRRHQFH